MKKSLTSGLLLLVCWGVAGCGGGAATAPPDPAVTSTPAAPSAPPTPTPTPTPPTKAGDQPVLDQALVTAADLGKPWIAQKSVPTTKNAKGEACPGHRDAAATVTTVASARRTFTEGKGQGVNIASITVATLPTTDGSALRSALLANEKGCAQFKDSAGLYVVTTAEGPTSATGAEEMLSAWTQRVYYDKTHKQLAYARHYLVTRSGRVVTSLEYDFLTTKQDPKAKDFGRASKLLAKQLSKNASAAITG